MATIQEINSSIIQGTFTNDQLNSIISAVKFARGQLVRQNRRAFGVGDMVKFTNSRTGRTEVGAVIKIMVKNIVVKTGNGMGGTIQWRVPASMLEAA